MDRVLLVIDDIQYAVHLEMTLRKVGFDLETLTNEYNLQEKLLSFNPNYIIVKGMSARVSTINIGKKLKESTKFLGKVILIFHADQKATPDEFIKMRMDLLLFEPISALRVVTQLLNLTQLDKDSILEKLLRFARTDSQFISYESQILKSTGSSIDSEIIIITGTSAQKNDKEDESLNLDDLLTFGDSDAKQNKKVEADEAEALQKLNSADFQVDKSYVDKLKGELKKLENELPLRIEAYNRSIKGFDQNLKLGLARRQTRKRNKKDFQDIPDIDNKLQDAERQRFVKALVKK
jgi:DNA-binding response OmpR family regulator